MLAARHYIPGEPAGPQPLLVFFHGGGFVLGDLDSHDRTCRLLCRHVGANVLSVAYRLAPEHPFPAAVDDGRAALRWAMENAAHLGADPARVGVGGDSAGGNIAAVVAWEAARDGGPAPVVQVLIYPATGRDGAHALPRAVRRGVPARPASRSTGSRRPISAVGPRGPRLSVLKAGDLAGCRPRSRGDGGLRPVARRGGGVRGRAAGCGGAGDAPPVPRPRPRVLQRAGREPGLAGGGHRGRPGAIRAAVSRRVRLGGLSRAPAVARPVRMHPRSSRPPSDPPGRRLPAGQARRRGRRDRPGEVDEHAEGGPVGFRETDQYPRGRSTVVNRISVSPASANHPTPSTTSSRALGT